MTMVVRLPRSPDGDKVLGDQLAAGTASHGAQGTGHRALGIGHWALGIDSPCAMPHAPCPIPISFLSW